MDLEQHSNNNSRKQKRTRRMEAAVQATLRMKVIRSLPQKLSNVETKKLESLHAKLKKLETI